MTASKSQLKLIKSLQQKKFRVKTGLFVVEGIKVVNELLNSTFELEQLLCVDSVLEDYQEHNPISISANDLKKVSSLKSPNKIIALFKIPEGIINESNDLKVVLDDVNDPGNLGTIIRLCDWFGVKNLICSKNTVDCYNAKVVQSTMGSLTRVSIQYIDLERYLSKVNQPVYIADMEGENIYQATLPKNGIIVMGNEANGVSNAVRALVENKISIPRFGDLQQTESLNVATATSIILSEFRRTIER